MVKELIKILLVCGGLISFSVNAANSIPSTMFPTHTPPFPAMCWTDMDEMYRYHMYGIDQQPVAMGKTAGGGWIIIFSNKHLVESGGVTQHGWSLVVVLPSGLGCAIMIGSKWENIPFELFEFPPIFEKPESTPKLQ